MGMDAGHVVVQMIFVRSPTVHVATAEKAQYHRRKRTQNHCVNLMPPAAINQPWEFPDGEKEMGFPLRFPSQEFQEGQKLDL